MALLYCDLWVYLRPLSPAANWAGIGAGICTADSSVASVAIAPLSASVQNIILQSSMQACLGLLPYLVSLCLFGENVPPTSPIYYYLCFNSALRKMEGAFPCLLPPESITGL